jgi:hypothetical protein
MLADSFPDDAQGPPASKNAATMAMAMVDTVVIRRPTSNTGSTSGSSTRTRICLGLRHVPVATSTTARSTPLIGPRRCAPGYLDNRSPVQLPSARTSALSRAAEAQASRCWEWHEVCSALLPGFYSRYFMEGAHRQSGSTCAAQRSLARMVSMPIRPSISRSLAAGVASDPPTRSTLPRTRMRAGR